MEDDFNANQVCDLDHMVQLDQFNTSVDGSGTCCPMQYSSTHPDDQYNTRSLHTNATMINQVVIN
jgi:hypothetical protein